MYRDIASSFNLCALCKETLMKQNQKLSKQAKRDMQISDTQFSLKNFSGYLRSCKSFSLAQLGKAAGRGAKISPDGNEKRC